MKQGELSDYFVGVGAKVLRGTEVDPRISNGHELQGISRFHQFIGDRANADQLPVTFIWLDDQEPPVELSLTATWYDSRKNAPGRAAEYRFYYPAAAEEVVYRARAGDTLILCQPVDGPLLALFCPHDSTIEHQLLWLFGLDHPRGNIISQIDLRRGNDRELGYVSRQILKFIGVETVVTEDKWLDKLLETFGSKFPTTRQFSDFTRNAFGDADPIIEPDATLLGWIDFEERLFMTLERHIVAERLREGFLVGNDPDIEGFVGFSLSVQNRRKSRAGWAFANHIEAILSANRLCFKREATTEKRNGPDFLFPGETEYHDRQFPEQRLTMLGAKTSCKDRWRQVLAEANRIPYKHLMTLEPGISETQTDEMKRAGLVLVLPQQLHETYRPEQQDILLNVAEFLYLVRCRQGR